MSIAVEGTPVAAETDPFSYAPETGSNRLVLWGLGTRQNPGDSTYYIVSAVYDSVAMVADGGIVNHTNVASRSAALFRALEADLPASAQDLNVTFDTNTPSSLKGAAMTLSGVNQTSPVTDSDTVNDSSQTTTDHAFSVSVVDGGMTVGVFASSDDFDATSLTGAGYTVDYEEETGANNVLVAHKAITSTGTENLTVSLDTVGTMNGILVAYASPTAGTRRYRISSY